MAVDVTLTPITTGYNVSKINSNFTAIEDALADAFSLSGSSPNGLSTDINLDSNDILNGGVGNFESIVLNGTELVVDALLAKGDKGDKGDTGATGPQGASGSGSGDMISTQNLHDVANVATARTNLGLGTASSPQFTGIELGNASDTTLTRVSAGVIAVEGNNVLTTATGQPLDATLTAVAGLTTAADKVPYFTASDVASTMTVTAAARTVLDDTTTGAMLTTLGAQPLDSDLTTIAGLTATTDAFLQSKASAWTTRTPTQVTADLIPFVGDSGSGGTKGLVPAPAGGDSTKVLHGDGTWQTVSGAGGGMTLISTLTTTSGTSQSATWVGTYRFIYIEFEDVIAGGIHQMKLSISSNGGSTYSTAVNITTDPGTSGARFRGVAIIEGAGLTNQQGKFVRPMIFEDQNDTVYTTITILDAAGSIPAAHVNGVKVTGGTFSNGTIRIYGAS